MKIKITTGLILGIFLLSILLIVLLVSLVCNFSGTLWKIILFASLFIAALLYEILEKRKNTNLKTEFLKIGEMIFPDYKNVFFDFYNLYLNDRKKFLTQSVFVSNGLGNFDLEDLKPIEVLYIFGDSKNLVHLIDWRGEENEKEIEEFIDRLLKQEHQWIHTSKLRNGLSGDKQRDGKFIIDLFQSVDKDLQAINKRVIFFELNWDAYVYTVIASETLDEIKKKSLNDFHGVDKLLN